MGSMPLNETLGGLVELTHLDVYNNRLHGSLPDALGSLTNLKYLDLRQNYFNGTLPSSLMALSQLTFLGLSEPSGDGNAFVGSFPLAALTSMTNLSVSETFIDAATFAAAAFPTFVNVSSAAQLSRLPTLLAAYAPPTHTISAVLQADLQLSWQIVLTNVSLQIYGNTGACLAARPAGSPLPPLCTLVAAPGARHLSLQNSSLELFSLALLNGYDHFYGGAVAADGSSSLSAQSCTFSGNTAGMFGGAIFAENGNAALALSGCAFFNNTQQAAGSGHLQQVAFLHPGGSAVYANGPVNLANCTFCNNTAAQGLGAVYAPTVTVVRGAFSHNAAGAGGGALAVNTFHFTTNGFCTTATGPLAAPCDEAIAISPTALFLTSCNFTGNTAVTGSGTATQVIFHQGLVSRLPRRRCHLRAAGCRGR